MKHLKQMENKSLNAQKQTKQLNVYTNRQNNPKQKKRKITNRKTQK